MTCSVNVYFSKMIPVSLGPKCCTSLMCLVHLLWMRTAVPWHALLFPVAAKVRPCLVIHNTSFCFLQHSLIVRSPLQLSNEFLDPVTLVSERVFFRAIVFVIVSRFVLLSLCVLFLLPWCVLSGVSWVRVVGCGCVVKLIGTSPCTVLSWLSCFLHHGFASLRQLMCWSISHRFPALWAGWVVLWWC